MAYLPKKCHRKEYTKQNFIAKCYHPGQTGRSSALFVQQTGAFLDKFQDQIGYAADDGQCREDRVGMGLRVQPGSQVVKQAKCQK